MQPGGHAGQNTGTIAGRAQLSPVSALVKGGAETCAQPARVEGAVARLDTAIDSLDSTIARLEKRLDAVLLPPTQPPSAVACPDGPASQLTASIYDRAGKVGALACAIESIIERIDL